MNEKKLYKIGYVTQSLNITARTLRYYEQYGLLPYVKRSDGAMRLYTEDDILLIKEIKRLQKQKNMPLDAIKIKLFGSEELIHTSSIAILSDSSVLLDRKLLKFPVDVIPFTFKFGDENIIDDSSITQKFLWDKCQEYGESPLTVAPSVDLFKETYQDLYKSGKKVVYSVHLSSTISSTFENARLAAADFSDVMTIYVLDSQTLGTGLGVLVQQLSDSIFQGDSMSVISSLLKKQISQIGQFVLVGSLAHLLQGGTLPVLGDINSTLLDSMLKLKPIFRLDPAYSDLDVIECSQTVSQGIDALFNLIENEILSRSRVADRIMIGYNSLVDEAKFLKKILSEKFPHVDIIVSESPCIVSTYLGPETLSVSIL